MKILGISSADPSLNFAVFNKKAKKGEVLCVAFLGGSLTWGAQATNPLKTSYRALISEKLRASYPKAHFCFVDGAIGGTGSQLAAFRLERDILAYNPDLVFLDFTVNDGPHGTPDSDRLASYESLVRRLVQAGIPIVQVILPVKQDVLPNPPGRLLDELHRKIGAAYGLPLADAVALVKERGLSGVATPDSLWDLPEDATHPGDAGYAIYAESAWRAFQNAIKEKTVCSLPEQMIYPETYMSVNRCRISSLGHLPNGWKIGGPHRSAIAFDFVCSRWMDDLAIAKMENEVEPAPLLLRVKATNILLFGEGTQQSGAYAVRIDDKQPMHYETYCKDGNMRYVQFVASGLEAEVEHRVEIIPKLKNSEELRLESICVAGSPASVFMRKSEE